ncbi:MAG: hypothetical protein M3521_01005 [Acidobacteriota bacterium]|jgi:hypothetical protein|nr:hypothetical protein [Acidobacteriota bacterium]
MLHDFQLAQKRIRLWQRIGESYEHVLMKALGFTLFIKEYPTLEIEMKVGLRYKPDLVARGDADNFLFWGEAGANSIRKTAWLLKHARVERLVLFKIAINEAQFIKQLREEIPVKYRTGGKLILINFRSEIKQLTATKQIERVSKDWFTETQI